MCLGGRVGCDLSSFPFLPLPFLLMSPLEVEPPPAEVVVGGDDDDDDGGDDDTVVLEFPPTVAYWWDRIWKVSVRLTSTLRSCASSTVV